MSSPQQRLPPPEGTKSPSEDVTTEREDQEYCSCGVEYGGEHRWTARDRTVIAKMEQYLNESDNMKEEIEELELLLGPEDSEVDLRERCTTSGVGWSRVCEESRGRHQAHCDERKGEKASQALSFCQWAGSSMSSWQSARREGTSIRGCVRDRRKSPKSSARSSNM